jgi:hypothetical protein
MTIVRFHGPIAGFSGAMDEMVFKDYKKKGKTVVHMKKHHEPTEAQLLVRERLSEAPLYAKAALEDPTKREFYQMVAREKDTPAFQVAVGDYMSKPVIKSVTLSDYRGQVGERIQIRAEQYIGLASVDVELFGMEGTLLENGRAFEAATRTGLWIYMGQTNIPVETQITIRVSGVDHNGKKAQLTETAIIGAQA